MTCSTEKSASQAVEKMAFTGGEVETITGLSKVTIWRLEKRGLLKPVPGIRNKLYSRKAVEAFLEGKVAA
jgi:predicted DNA-binding transcriptional regulator AlpA